MTVALAGDEDTPLRQARQYLPWHHNCGSPGRPAPRLTIGYRSDSVLGLGGPLMAARHRVTVLVEDLGVMPPFTHTVMSWSCTITLHGDRSGSAPGTTVNSSPGRIQ
ncbi:hypothetical protein [Streptomyces sp. NPDC058653]|uniref:hypothetical protein n=1 Tax=Streptomyces sp. NPDC058653 TaxID=3346576 RepID=UPI0036657697